MGISAFGNVGAGVGSSGSSSLNNYSNVGAGVSGVASAASVQAASPTTQVSSSSGGISNFSNVGGGADSFSNLANGVSQGGGNKNSSSGGISAVANVGAGVSMGSSDNTSNSHSNVQLVSSAGSNNRSDNIGSSTTFQQLDDMASDPSNKARTMAQILNDISTTQLGSGNSWDQYLQDINNGSMGFPGAPGYGLTYNPTQILGPTNMMAQDTGAMNKSLTATQNQPPFVLPNLDLSSIAHDLNGPYLAREAANGGQAPFSGVVDTQGILDALNAPYTARVAAGGAPSSDLVDVAGIAHALNGPYLAREAANGGVAPFPGVVDWNGIESALTGNGSGAAGTGASSSAAASPTALVQPADGTTWQEARAGLLAPDRLTADTTNVDQAAPAYTDTNSIARTVNADGSVSAPLTPAQAATQEAAALGIPLPIADPRGTLFTTNGQVTTPDGTVLTAGNPAAQNDVESAPQQTTMWDKVVNNTGRLLSHTGLGAVVSGLFPDAWNGMGDAFKSLGDNTGDTSGAPNPLDQMALNQFLGGSSKQQQSPQVVYVAANGTPATGGTSSSTGTATGAGSVVYPNGQYVVFPDQSYQPGIDPEWLYFRKQLANGNVVGYKDGGPVERDSRVTTIADCEDALATGGEVGHPAINRFITTFGNPALEQLRGNVKAGMTMRGRGRLISGPGGPTSDSVPAVITDKAGGTRPAALSDGEFVLPVSAVQGMGGGDHELGAQRLQQLSDALSAK